MKPVRILSVAVAAMACSAATAMAEDAMDWSRPYIGAMIGSGGGGGAIEGGGQPDIEFEDGGLTGGVFAGVGIYNFGASNGRGWLLSGETSFRLLNVDDHEDGGALGGAASLDGSWVADAMLQIGYGWERTRVYGGLGVALTDLSLDGPGSDGDDLTAGLALGVGAETMVDDDWTARLDLRAMGFGEEDRSFTGGDRDVGLGLSSATVGFSRRF